MSHATVLVQSASGVRLAVTVPASRSDARTCDAALKVAERRDPDRGWRALTVIDRAPLAWFERVVTL